MREKISNATKDAMKAKSVHELSTLRLMGAAIKSKDIDLRGKGGGELISDDEIMSTLLTLVKQRKESAETYKRGGRDDLADRELQEIEIIGKFLPKQMNDEEAFAVIDEAIAQTGANSPKDMGKVIAHLKSAYSGQLDFSKVSQLIKSKLG